jgi:hypothetical protein
MIHQDAVTGIKVRKTSLYLKVMIFMLKKVDFLKIVFVYFVVVLNFSKLFPLIYFVKNLQI